MGQTVLMGLLQANPYQRVTAITGTSPGKSAEDIYRLAEANGMGRDRLECASYADIDPDQLEKPESIILGVKPHKVASTLAVYEGLIDDHTQIISMAAGLSLVDYQAMVTSSPTFIRIMPHLPKGVYAIYGEDQAALDQAKTLCTGLGEAVELEDEKQMHGFIGIAGSAPAFIARFLESFAEGEERQQAMDGLQEPQAAQGRVATFYQYYRKAALQFFQEAQAEQIITITLHTTIEDMQKRNLSPSAYATAVRSPKGTTNIGLLVMGSPPPQEPRYGDEAQLHAQNTVAREWASIRPEEAIEPAIVATAMRSKAMSENLEDPLYGVKWDMLLQLK
jgi:pyrroline-5-carboxylate reductase